MKKGRGKMLAGMFFFGLSIGFLVLAEITRRSMSSIS